MNEIIERPDMNSCIKTPVAAYNEANNKNQDGDTALYMRLSREDDNMDDESISIGYQRKMLRSFAQEKGFNVYDEYTDDGRRGVTFDRPEFKRMMDDINIGRINNVIVKDLSRFGRNYSDATFLLDDYFPEHGVRLIAIDGSYDGDNDDNEMAPFANFFNEYYSRQTSKKMRRTRKTAANEGKFMGSIPPYGYKRSIADYHKLVIDEEAAEVVRKIFGLFKNGESTRHIADILNHENVLSPQAYYFKSVDKNNPYGKNAKTWCSTTIIALLKRDTYIGHMTQGRKKVKSYKDKRILTLPRDQWITKANMHEPIVDEETFFTVQEIFSTNKNSKPRRTVIGNEPSLFSNILHCKECGKKLNFNTCLKRGKPEHIYRCSGYIQHKTCTPHRISLELLAKVVLEDIQYYAQLATKDEETFIQQLHLMSKNDQITVINRYKKQITEIRSKIKKIDGLIRTAFEKNESGVISDGILNNLVHGYQCDRDALEAELPTLTNSLDIMMSKITDISKEVDNLRRYARITVLTREVVTNLIKAIYISEPVMKDKQKMYNIEIEYRFNNPRSITLEYFTGVGEWEEVKAV